MKPMFKKQKEKGKGDQRLESRRDHGGKAALPSGEPICFSTNISSCSGAADGAKCSKGLHVCAKCFSPHSMRDYKEH
jgi:hypothetical protein